MTRATFLPTLAALAAFTTWAYWSALTKAAERWANDPQYSHGYLIPLFAGYLLYHRRALLPAGPFAGSWWGLLPLAAAVALRAIEAAYFYNGLDMLSIVPAAAAAVLLTGGRPALRWAWPSVVFLAFMAPLPYQLQTAMSGQLQTVATQVSTALLVILGAPAVAEGNVIVLDDVRVGVVEACSGLGMVVTFAALSVGFAFVTRAAGWVRVALLIGALPVAVAANVVRITGTALLFRLGYGESAQVFFHDLAGWLMIPLGCLMILLEIYVLENMLTRDNDHDVAAAPLLFDLGPTQPDRPPTKRRRV